MLEVLAIEFAIMVASAWLARAVRCAIRRFPDPRKGGDRKVRVPRVHQMGRPFLNIADSRARDDELRRPRPAPPAFAFSPSSAPSPSGSAWRRPAPRSPLRGGNRHDGQRHGHQRSVGAGIGGISVQISKSDYSWFGSHDDRRLGRLCFADVLPGDYSVSVSLYVFPAGQLPYGYEPPVTTTITAGTLWWSISR